MVGILASSDPSGLTRNVQANSPPESETANVPPSLESAIPLGLVMPVSTAVTSPIARIDASDLFRTRLGNQDETIVCHG